MKDATVGIMDAMSKLVSILPAGWWEGEGRGERSGVRCLLVSPRAPSSFWRR